MSAPRFSSHCDFDDPRWWTFARTSGLPRGYFDRERMSTPGRLVIAGALIALLAALAIWVR